MNIRGMQIIFFVKVKLAYLLKDKNDDVILYIKFDDNDDCCNCNC